MAHTALALVTFVRTGGLIGLAIVFLSFVLLVANVVVLATARRRAWAVVMLVLGLAPAMLGLLGTVIGCVRVHQVAAQSGAANAKVIAEGYSTALVTTWIGVAGTVVLLALAVAALIVTGKRGAGP